MTDSQDNLTPIPELIGSLWSYPCRTCVFGNLHEEFQEPHVYSCDINTAPRINNTCPDKKDFYQLSFDERYIYVETQHAKGKHKEVDHQCHICDPRMQPD